MKIPIMLIARNTMISIPILHLMHITQHLIYITSPHYILKLTPTVIVHIN